MFSTSGNNLIYVEINSTRFVKNGIRLAGGESGLWNFRRSH